MCVCVFQESSSAQFGPEFCNLPPPTTGFTALALRGNILQPRSPTDTPKRFKTEAPVESPSTSITLPIRTPPRKYFSMFSQDPSFQPSIHHLSIYDPNISFHNYIITKYSHYQLTKTLARNKHLIISIDYLYCEYSHTHH